MIAALILLCPIAAASTRDMGSKAWFFQRVHGGALAKTVSVHPHPSGPDRCWAKAELLEVYRNSAWKRSSVITVHRVDCCVSEGDLLLVALSDLIPPHERVTAFRSESESCLLAVDFCSRVQWFRAGMPTTEPTRITEDATCSELTPPLGEWRTEEPPIPDLPEFSLEQGYHWKYGRRMPEGWTPPPEEPLTDQDEDASQSHADEANTDTVHEKKTPAEAPVSDQQPLPTPQ